MIHCDNGGLNICGTRSDIIADIMEIFHELAEAEIIIPEKSQVAFFLDPTQENPLEAFRADSELISISKYGGK